MLDELRALGEMPEWFRAFGDPERMRDRLQRAVPEFASGALILQHVRAKRLRIKRDALRATYELTVDGMGGGPRTLEIAGLVQPRGSSAADAPWTEGVFGQESWRCHVPELGLVLESAAADAGLPALPLLTDPAEARTILERGIRDCSPRYSDIRIEACTPKVARYKPGSRCTIVYRLEYPAVAEAREWPDLVVAKTHSGSKGRNAYDGMRALWESELGNGSVVSLAEPLAFLPELNVLVQGPVREERILKDLLESALKAGTSQAIDEVRSFFVKTAAGLAALHRCGVDYGEVLTWDDELAEIREVEARLAQWVPEISAATEPTLSQLESLAADHKAEPAAPCHRSFRPAQVLIHGGDIGFIDFDGFCRAEPALDVALFRATVRDVGMRVALKQVGSASADALMPRLPMIDELCDAFLAGYESHAEISRTRVALWEALDLLTNVLHNWTKVRPERLGGTMLLLERHLRRADLESV